MKLAKLLFAGILVLLLVLQIWYYTRKTGPAFELDPYPVLRQQTGPFSESAWKGTDAKYNADGFWIIIGQDLAPADYNTHKRLHESVKAYLKGTNIMPSTWIFRDQLLTDFQDFLAEFGHFQSSAVFPSEFLPQ